MLTFRKRNKLKFMGTIGFLLVLTLSGCAIPPMKSVAVYQSRGAIQCESAGMSIDESRERLLAMGVSVESSQCAQLDDHLSASVCGGKTADILVHTLDARYAALAQEMGFTLLDEGIGSRDTTRYTIIPCE